MSDTPWKILIVFAVFMQFLVTEGPMYNYNVFFVDLQNEFHSTAVMTGWLGSMGSAIFCVSAPLAAVVASRIGNFYTVVLGTVLGAAGYLTTSFIPSLGYGFLTFGTMAGLGTGFAFCASGSVILDWFSGKKSNCRATGTAMIGASVGVMVFGPLLNIMNAAYGWRTCFRILSGTVLLLGMAASLPFLKTPGSLSFSVALEDQENTAGSSSTEADRATAKEGSDRGPEKEMLNARDKMPGDETVDGDHVITTVLANVEVWLWVASATLAQLGWSFVIVNYSSLMDELGLSTDEVSLALIVFGGAEVGGKILFAVLGDHLPFLRLYLTAGTSVVGAIIAGFLTLSKNSQHMVIMSTAWGIARGILYGACFAAGDELFSIYGPHVVAAISIIGYGLGVLIGAPITGALFDLTGDYTLSLLVLVAAFVLSALCVLIIPLKRRIQSRKARLDKERYQCIPLEPMDWRAVKV